MSTRPSPVSAPVVAGVVSGLVGFTSSFPVVLTGLLAVGATAAQGASGLMVLCLTMGVGTLVFSWRTRTPVTMAWSTPGAALLATAAAPSGGFEAAVGAFVVCGVLLALCGLVSPLATLVRSVPAPLASAMLAGVLLPLGVRPFLDLVASPWTVAPLVLVWLVVLRLSRRWAVPAVLVVALVVTALSGSFARVSGPLLPTLVPVLPDPDLVTAVSIGLPLFLVTMSSQNVAGLAVLGSFGFHPPFRPVMVYTGLASAVGALGGGHAINLAAISAALAAGPEAGEDTRRRWLAGISCGLTYLLFVPLSAAATALAQAAPPGVLGTLAGLALLPTFAASGAQALAEPRYREAAAVTFLVAASGLTVVGVGGAFWGLLGGLAVSAVLGARRRSG